MKSQFQTEFVNPEDENILNFLIQNSYNGLNEQGIEEIKNNLYS